MQPVLQIGPDLQKLSDKTPPNMQIDKRLLDMKESLLVRILFNTFGPSRWLPQLGHHNIQSGLRMISPLEILSS